MKLATWNVNSLKVRLPHVLDWLASNPVDVLCLQETKQQDENFPQAALQAAGYHSVFCGQKTYNGVAILSREPPSEVQYGIPGHADEQKRVIAATFAVGLNPVTARGQGDRMMRAAQSASQSGLEDASKGRATPSDQIRVVCVYVPNGQSVDSDKYYYKLGWLKTLSDWLKEELKRYPKLAVLGDYNIAPEDRDVHDPVAWQGNVLVSEAERIHFQNLIKLGLRDSFRLFEQAEKSFTWWDYRMMAFRRNHGLRIDHILISESLVAQCKSCVIDKSPRKLQQPSDHAPVVVEL